MTEASTTALAHSSHARILTAKARTYMIQLCKHFGHKIPVTYDDTNGRIEFPFGVCRAEADADALTLTSLAADEAQLHQLKDVIARHLVRFAFKEELVIEWKPDLAA
jgi:hypothetical protein